MSSEKPVRFIHKSATVRSVDYSNAQFEVIYLSFLILQTVVRRTSQENARCHSDGFNDGEIFSTGGRELKEREAQVYYNTVDVSSLPLGIVLRRLTRLYTSRIHLSLPFSKRNFAHCVGVYIVLCNLSHNCGVGKRHILECRRIITLL